MGEQRHVIRTKSKVDMMPDEIKRVLDELLRDRNNEYTDIANTITAMGYPISRSSVGRYAYGIGVITERLREVAEQTKAIIEATKDGDPLKVISAVTDIAAHGLVRKIAMAQEEIENMPIEKAMKHAENLKRIAILEARHNLTYNKGYKQALADVKLEFLKIIKQDPSLADRINEIISKVEDKINKKLEGDSDG